MKKFFISFSILFCATLISYAQSQTLQLVYITKDHTTETNPLVRDIMDLYHSAERDKSQAVIFYLANASRPIIVKVNLPDDNRKDMNMIIDALVSKSETMISPSDDLRHFVEIFNQHDVIDENQNPLFLNAEILYYITPAFWELQYNEQIIAAAYFALGMDEPWANGYFSMSIYHNENDGLVVNQDMPFGHKRLCKNYNFFLLTYSN